MIAGYFLIYKKDTSSDSVSSDIYDLQICPKNNTAYPMKGGPGCAEPCPHDYNYSVTYNYYMNDSIWNIPFLNNINISTYNLLDYVSSLGLSKDSTVWIDQFNETIHMTMDYFCCLNSNQIKILNQTLNNYKWPKINVSFDQVECTQDGYFKGDAYKFNEIVEIIAYADKKSQIILQEHVNVLEHILNTSGVPIKVPRSDNIGFHVTIGFVNGSAGYPTDSLITKLNDIINWANVWAVIDNGTFCNGNTTYGNITYKCLN